MSSFLVPTLEDPDKVGGLAISSDVDRYIGTSGGCPSRKGHFWIFRLKCPKAVIASCALTSCLLAQDIVNPEDFVPISSIPFICNVPGGRYLLTEDLVSSSGTAIEVAADHVFIHGNGKTLTYASTDAGTGISLTSHVSALEISHITLIQGSGGGSAISGNERNPGALKINHCTISCLQTGGPAVSLSNIFGVNIGIEISDCSISVNSLTPLAGHGIVLQGTGTISGRIHHNTISLGNGIWAGRSTAIGMLVTSGVMEVDNNTVYMNHGYQGEGIRTWGDGDNLIHNNAIYMNSHNSRGINLDGNSDNNLVYGNVIHMNIPVNPPPGEGSSDSYGFRIRFGSDNNQIYDNVVESISGSSICLSIGGAEVSPRGNPLNNVIRNNRFFSNFRCVSIYDGTLGPTEFAGNIFTATTSSAVPVFIRSHPELSGIVFSDNQFEYPGAYAAVFNHYYGQHLDPVIFTNCSLSPQDINGVQNTDYTINEPPEFATVGNRSVPAGQQLRFSVEATDSDADPLSYGATGPLP